MESETESDMDSPARRGVCTLREQERVGGGPHRPVREAPITVHPQGEYRRPVELVSDTAWRGTGQVPAAVQGLPWGQDGRGRLTHVRHGLGPALRFVTVRVETTSEAMERFAQERGGHVVAPPDRLTRPTVIHWGISKNNGRRA